MPDFFGMPWHELALRSVMAFVGGFGAVVLVNFVRHFIREWRGDNPDLPF